MVKYQFTSEDAEKQIVQVAKLQAVIDQQAIIIKKLKMENDLLRLQLQKLSQQIEQTQEKQQSNSDLLEIKEENQNRVSSTLPLFQNDKLNFQTQSDILNKDQNLFALNSSTQYRNDPILNPQQQNNPFQTPSDSQLLKLDLVSHLQFQSNQVEQEKASQQNNNQTSLFGSNNQSQQQQSLFSNFLKNPSHNLFSIDLPNKNTNNLFSNSVPSTNTNNHFCKEVSNEDNQKQQINSQEDHEEESLLFGDPSNYQYNVQKSESKTSDKGSLFNQEEQINNQDIKQLENSKESSFQNSNSFQANSNEKYEQFQIIQRDEESNSN